MLAIFDRVIGNPPEELELPAKGFGSPKSREQIVEIFQSRWPQSTLYNISNGNYMALSRGDESPMHPRSIVVVEDVFCIFVGTLVNMAELRHHYGLPRQATEAMIAVEAYKVLRDRAPYPPDQVVKDMEGKFTFIIFDARTASLFTARDRDGRVELQWGIASDGSMLFSDDPNIIREACGNCFASFPAGCIFMNGSGLTSFDHPLHKVRAVLREDDNGNVCGVTFQVDMFTRLHSIPRTGSAANWAGAAMVEGD